MHFLVTGATGFAGGSPFLADACQRSIRQGIIRTLHYLQTNRWALEIRQ